MLFRSENTEAEENTSRNYSVRENFSINYRSEIFDLGLRGNYNWSKTDNTISKTSNQTVQDFGGTANLTLYFPWSIVFDTDFTYTGMSGYAAAFGKSEKLWNAKLTKSFMNKKGTVYARVNDILRDKRTISRNVSASSIQDIRTDQLTSYAMVGVSYRFSTMGSGNNRSSSRNGYGGMQRGDRMGGGGFDHGGFGGGPM